MKKYLIIFINILIILLFITVFLFIYNYSFYKKDKITVELEKCIDGDTVWLKNNNEIKKYRMLGINTPELNENYGIEATNFTCKLLNSAKKIEIEYDKIGETNDKYGRELVWIYIDNKLLQTIILEEGYAKVKYIYGKYKYLENLYNSEKVAKENKLNIWKEYVEQTYSTYYKVTLDYTYKLETIEILENDLINHIKNPYKYGCKFIGWQNNNYLFDLTTNINKDYKLKAKFEC